MDEAGRFPDAIDRLRVALLPRESPADAPLREWVFPHAAVDDGDAVDCLLVHAGDAGAVLALLSASCLWQAAAAPAVVVCPGAGRDVRRTLLQAGVSEVVTQATAENVRRAIEDAVDRVASTPSPAARRMQATFEHAAVGIAHVGMDGRFVAVNPALVRLTGYTAEELSSKTFGDITHPDDLHADWAQAQRLMAGEITSYAMEKRYIRKDGQSIWVSLSASMVDDGGGRFFVAVIEDLSARKAAENESRRLQELIEHSADFIAMTDLDGRLTYLNAGGRAMIGFPPAAPPGELQFSDYVPETQQDFFRHTVLPAAREKGMWEGEMQLRHRGSRAAIDVWCSTFVLHDPQSGVPSCCYAIVARDITAARAAERALRRADEHRRAALSAVEVGLWYWDLSRGTIMGDSNLLRLFGIAEQAEELPVEPYLERMHAEDRERVTASIHRVIKNGGPFEEVYRVVHPDGQLRWLHARGFAELGADGRPASFPGILLDVTQSHEALAQLRESDERYQALLRSVDDGFCIVEVIFDEGGTRAIDYRFIELNASFARQTGLADAQGKSVRSLLPALDEFWFETYGAVALTGVPARFERFEPAMDRWFEVEALRVGEPQRRRVAILFRDITARRMAEESLRQSERSARQAERFALSILDNLFAFVGVLDAQGILLDANRAPLSAAGLDMADVRGKPFWDCYWWSYDEDIRQLTRQACQRAAGGETVRYDVAVRMAGESRMTIDFQIAPLYDEQGRLTHLIPSGVDITERKQVELELRRTEARLRRALAAARAGTFDFGTSPGEAPVVSDSLKRLFGFADTEQPTVAEYVGRVHPDDRPRVADIITASINNGRGHYVEYRIVCEGRLTWVASRAEVLLDAQGQAERITGVLLDITERKQAEEALLESERRAQEAAARAESERAVLDAILAAAPAGIILANAEGRLLRMNPANEMLWGIAPHSGSVDEYAEWKGWWADPSERRGQRVAPHEWAMARALRGEVVRDDVVEIEPFGQPGVRRTMVNSGAPVRDAQGNITGAVVAQMDISALVFAEAARRESEAQFRALADNIPQLAWMTDETGHIHWYNQRWFDYTGGSLQEMQGWGWEKVHHPDHLPRVVEKFSRHIQTGEPWEDTFPLRRYDGHYRWFLSRAFPLRDKAGQISGWFGTNTDITEQREAEEALREADRRKDQFIAILAHELRNPLAPVANAVEVLQKLGPHQPSTERMHHIIDRQIKHMARLIDDLLDVARIARGKLALHMEVCDLAAIAANTVEDYRASFDAAGIALAFESGSAGLWVEGDAVRLAQMIGNYLQNARKFTPSGGRVDVRAAVHNGEAIVTVTDTGEGIDPELLGRLFDSFSQAEQGLARSAGGLGLGLALTKGLAQLHQGKVDAFSAGKGRGATFSLRLPLSGPPVAADRSGAVGEQGRLRILIIEDNEDAGESLRYLLELCGHDVRLAAEGESGLRLAAEFLPGVVISDIGLPGELDGYAIARTLKADARLRGAYLLALSGYANDEARQRSFESGFDHHLAKPVDFALLQQLLAGRGRPA